MQTPSSPFFFYHQGLCSYSKVFVHLSSVLLQARSGIFSSHAAKIWHTVFWQEAASTATCAAWLMKWELLLRWLVNTDVREWQERPLCAGAPWHQASRVQGGTFALIKLFTQHISQMCLKDFCINRACAIVSIPSRRSGERHLQTRLDAANQNELIRRWGRGFQSLWEFSAAVLWVATGRKSATLFFQ